LICTKASEYWSPQYQTERCKVPIAHQHLYNCVIICICVYRCMVWLRQWHNTSYFDRLTALWGSAYIRFLSVAYTIVKSSFLLNPNSPSTDLHHECHCTLEVKPPSQHQDTHTILLRYPIFL
jgi:hypothetical protein